MNQTPQLRFSRLKENEQVYWSTCGNTELDEFLHEDAVDYQTAKLATTYLCHLDGEVVGYVTLAADAVRLDERERQAFLESKARLHEFAAIKIARLAVIKRWQGKGIGTLLLKGTFGIILGAGETIGCRFATVDAKPHAKGFYDRHGFVKNMCSYPIY